MTDQNDNAPRFARPNYEFPLSSLNDTNIGRVQAIDDDLDSGGVVKFRLLQQIEVSSGISSYVTKERMAAGVKMFCTDLPLGRYT